MQIQALDADRAEVRGVCNGFTLSETLFIPRSWKGHRVVQIAPYAFKGIVNLKHVILSEKLEIIGVESFAACEHLESVTFGEALRLID